MLRSFISCRELGVQAGGEGSREPPALSPPRPPPQWQNLPMGAGLCHLPLSRVRGMGQCRGRGAWTGMGAQAAAAPGMEQWQPGLAVSPRFPQEMRRAGGSNARGWASSGPGTPRAPRPRAEHAGSVPGVCRAVLPPLSSGLDVLGQLWDRQGRERSYIQSLRMDALTYRCAVGLEKSN